MPRPSSSSNNTSGQEELAALRSRVAELEAKLERIKLDDAQQELRESENRFRLLAENVPGVIYLCRNDSRYSMIYLNDAVERLTGYPASWFIRDQVSFVDLYHPEDSPWIAAEVDRALSKRTSFHLKYRIRHRAGHWVWVQETGAGVFEGDQLLYLEGFLLDVTEQEEAQRALALAHDKLAWHVDNTPLAVIEWDRQWRLLRWSQRAEEIFGWLASEVMGKTWAQWRFVYEEDMARVVAITDDLICGRTKANTCHNRNYAKDGRVLNCQWFNSALLDEQGQVVSILSFVLDVTDRVAADEALRDSERRYRRIIDTATEGIWLIDAQMKTTLANARMAEMLATSLDDVLEAPLHDFIEDDDWQVLLEKLERRKKGLSDQYEFRFRRRDGHHIWVLMSTAPLMDEGGRYQGSMAMMTDITDRKLAEEQVRRLNAELEQRVAMRTAELLKVNQQLHAQIEERHAAEQALRESEHRLQSILDNTTAVVFVKDCRGRFTLVNRRFEKLFSVTQAQIVGQTVFDRYSRPIAQKLWDNDQQVLRERRAIQFEEVVEHADGPHTYVSVKFPLFDDAGEPYAVAGVATDITDRKRAEDALRLVRSAVDQVGDSVVITDAMINPPGPRILYANPAFERMTGYRESEVLGLTPRLLQGPETQREVLDRVRQSLERGEPFHGETTNYRKDGVPYYVEWHIAPVRDDSGRLTNWVSIQRDITQRRAQEEVEREHQAELAHVARLSTMGEMASGLAHELNQPLSAISNYIRGCLRRFEGGRLDTEQLTSAMERVAQQADRAGQIIHRLRNFVKKSEPRRSTFDLNEVIRDAVGLTIHDAREAGIVIRMDLDEDLPEAIGDAIQIEQVILNLLRNAIEATDPAATGSKPVVRVVAAHDPERRELRVSVIDQGVGVTGSQLDKIFHPFFTTKAQGMGMGLNISQSIAEAHGGRLLAEPNPQRGMTFVLVIPVIQGLRHRP